MGRLTTYLDIKSCKILRSGFDFTSNLTSAIGDLANRGFLASYVSHHTAMAYDTHSPLHDTTKFRIICNVPIHPHILEKQQYLLSAINSFGSCYGILYDFSNGLSSPHLTCIFYANRKSSYFTITYIQSQIIEVNKHDINLCPTLPITQPPSAAILLWSNPSSPSSRSRGRGSTCSPNHTPPLLYDCSGLLYRIQQTSPLGLQPKFSHKFYVIINGVGGIAVANVSQLNFNDDGIRARVINVPFSSHKSFPTEVEAWNYFTLYYPHINSPSDAKFMNENCPVEASNLNNPSRHFQEVSGLNFNIPCNTHEFLHFDNLPPTIQASRRAASARMIQLGLTPINDFTFLRSPPTDTTTSPTIVSPKQPSPTVTSPSVVNPNHNNSTTVDLMSILSHADNAIYDDISSQASHLNLDTKPSTTNKRACSTLSQFFPTEPTYIFPSTPVTEPPSTTHNNLQTALSAANLPQNLLSPPIIAWVPPSALHANKKLVFTQLHDASYSNQVLRAIQLSIHLSMPQISSSIPPQPTIDNVDQSLHCGSIFPRFCRITTCPHHYGGNDFFSNDKTGYLHAELHGNNMHQSLLLSLPSNILKSIGWHRCCDIRPKLFLSTKSHNHHH